MATQVVSWDAFCDLKAEVQQLRDEVAHLRLACSVRAQPDGGGAQLLAPAETQAQPQQMEPWAAPLIGGELPGAGGTSGDQDAASQRCPAMEALALAQVEYLQELKGRQQAAETPSGLAATREMGPIKSAAPLKSAASDDEDDAYWNDPGWLAAGDVRDGGAAERGDARDK